MGLANNHGADFVVFMKLFKSGGMIFLIFTFKKYFSPLVIKFYRLSLGQN